ncbi:hypothetical protein IL54_2071 [Sphingobium sp. ba1]|nr:hypothetical protein IL54_2071 [Sphingobium sp. ba1]
MKRPFMIILPVVGALGAFGLQIMG